MEKIVEMTYEYTMLSFPEIHDEVLGRGSVPLSFLDANIRAWVGTKKAE